MRQITKEENNKLFMSCKDYCTRESNTNMRSRIVYQFDISLYVLVEENTGGRFIVSENENLPSVIRWIEET